MFDIVGGDRKTVVPVTGSDEIAAMGQADARRSTRSAQHRRTRRQTLTRQSDCAAARSHTPGVNAPQPGVE